MAWFLLTDIRVAYSPEASVVLQNALKQERYPSYVTTSILHVHPTF